MAQTEVFSFEKSYEEANNSLKNKDLLEFISKISIAEMLAQNNKDMLAKATFLKVKGLFNFHQHKKILEYIPQALEYNTGYKILRLKNYEGRVYGFLGELKKAEKIFLDIIKEIEEHEFLVEVYLNLAWVYLIKIDSNTLEEAGKYLRLAHEYFDLLSNEFRWKICNDFSVYYFYKKEYNKAIKILEDSIQYCQEQDLPDIYNNLAELYLKKTNDGIVPEIAKEYLNKAEILATQYNNEIALGYIFYSKAMIEVNEDQLFTALDTLYLSFEYFKATEMTIKACDTLMKINELMDEYKYNSLKSVRENLKNKIKDIPYYEKVDKIKSEG